MAEEQRRPLPLPDYDQLPAASIEHRIRPLALADVKQLLEYEQAHAGRPQVIAFLTERVRELESGAEPTSGDPRGEQPDRPDPTPKGSPAAPDKAGEPTEPLRHGTGPAGRGSQP